MPSTEFKALMNDNFVRYFTYLKGQNRKSKNKELAAIIGISPQSVSQILNGDRIITVEQLANLVKKTNLNANWFLTGDGPMTTDEIEKSRSLDAISKFAEVERALQNLEEERNKAYAERKQLLNMVEKLMEERDSLIKIVKNAD